jgi:hypothetical protein
VPLLLFHGFEVVGRQVRSDNPLSIGGQPIPVPLRADYMVTKGALRYVAEVKTGIFATQIGTAATRRQLLEYRVAFDVDGVLLVDAEWGTVREVVFHRLASFRECPAWPQFQPGVVAAANLAVPRNLGITRRSGAWATRGRGMAWTLRTANARAASANRIANARAASNRRRGAR